MKTFEVSLKRESYVTIQVEAETQDQAEALTWQRVLADDVEISDAAWDIDSIEVIKTA
jgi:hypothetical protein